MANDPIRLPSGQGGLTRFTEEYHSKLEISPKGVIILIALVIVALILLNYFGGRLLS
ncbi:preprotein translocase subunit Sec61beta [Candidatus Woesearchaeota archaeon]|nr:preprotein translocase subunit Sec61beta [Candidatus Woesearchaeota archaeon]